MTVHVTMPETKLTLEETKAVNKLTKLAFDQLQVNEGEDNSLIVGKHTLKLSEQETAALNNAMHKMQID